MKKIQRNSHKEAEFHRTGPKPEYYKTTEVLSIKKPNQTKVFHFLPFVPAENPQSFFAQPFFFLFLLFSLNEKVFTELRGQKDD